MKPDKLAKIFAGLALHAYQLGKRVGLAWRKEGTRLSYGVSFGQKERKRRMLQLKITDEQQIVVHVNPKSHAGKNVQLDGTPAWTVLEGNSQVQVSDDGMSATVISSDQPGLTRIQVQADANLGEEIETITDVIEIQVVDPQAESLGLSADQPTDKQVTANA